MSLRVKIALAVLLAAVVFVGSDVALRSITFSHRIEDFGRDRILKIVEEASVRIEAIGNDLDRVARGVAGDIEDAPSWDERVGDRADGIAVIQSDGHVVLHRLRDPITGSDLKLKELPNERFGPDHPMLPTPLQASGASSTGLQIQGVPFPDRGLFVTAAGPMMMLSHDLPGGDGRLILVRFIDDEFLTDLRTSLGAPLELVEIQSTDLSDREQEVVSTVGFGGKIVDPDEDGWRAWTVLRDIYDGPSLLLRVRTQDDVSELLAELGDYTLTSTIGLATLFSLLVLILLQFIVTGPVSRLTEHAVRIGNGDSSSARLGIERTDEIGRLAGEFDQMLEKLDRSRQEVVRNARQAGISQVSAGIAHNIGNQLNGIRVSLRMAMETLDTMKPADLRAIHGALASHAGDLDNYLESDSRGRHLLSFFDAIVGDHETRSVAATEELTTLGKSVDEIESLIGSLSAFDRMDLAERVDLRTQVDSAIELCLNSSERGGQIEVVRAYEELPKVLLDRNKLLEALVNVFVNATQAFESAGTEFPVLTVRIEAEATETVLIEIEDNGPGIEREDLTRIFHSGHTSREDSRGMGLHLAATTLGEMKGSIWATSDGPGTGATFSLRLPMTAEAAEAGHARA